MIPPCPARVARHTSMLRQSSLGATVHRTIALAAELRAEARSATRVYSSGSLADSPLASSGFEGAFSFGAASLRARGLPALTRLLD